MKSCKEITELASESLDAKLPLGTRMGMRMHMWMCKYCGRYLAQITFLHKVMDQYAEQAGEESEDGPRLSDEARHDLDEIIHKAMK